ncbi:hypothetical protein O0Q50_19980 [Priestia aryabhattai]|uniref:Uncharacterized protein n=1 Tax=Priestia aryabhattai TaxID=412384 RepID=A0AAX6NCD9_PRIAR|nr:hypothetical protein [Priestia aryabhattai]MDU9693457.1 hypothetical protein [Priestia aryabhattai]
MEISRIKKQWDTYINEFEKSDYMDVEKHTSMALKVGSLLQEIEKLNSSLYKINFLKHSFVGNRTELHREISRIIKN